jgi:hypothetical protein
MKMATTYYSNNLLRGHRPKDLSDTAYLIKAFKKNY